MYAEDSNSAFGTDQPEGPMSEAQSSLSATYQLHKLIDELEARLFGSGPKPVGSQGANEPSAPVLAYTLKHTRQRLDSAVSHLSQILGRI